MLLPRFVLCLAAGICAIPASAADLEAVGVPNFHQVNEHLYRGGQPSDVGWESLAKLGVTKVIDLRLAGEHSIAAESKAVEAAGMEYVSEPLAKLHAPTTAAILRILALLESNPDERVFVHCHRGADRTGTVIACYRIAHDHWSNQRALREARSYGMSAIERGMKHFIQNFHIEGLASEAGFAQPSETKQ